MSNKAAIERLLARKEEYTLSSGDKLELSLPDADQMKEIDRLQVIVSGPSEEDKSALVENGMRLTGVAVAACLGIEEAEARRVIRAEGGDEGPLVAQVMDFVGIGKGKRDGDNVVKLDPDPSSRSGAA